MIAIKIQSYDVIDDAGVWIVAPRAHANGRFKNIDAAEFEVDARNFSHGVADENGVLYAASNGERDELFARHHLNHKDCTCAKTQGVAHLNQELGGAREAQYVDHRRRGRRGLGE